MSLIILLIIVVGFILISTENVTNVNKAAVAIFVGTVGWVLYHRRDIKQQRLLRLLGYLGTNA